MWCIYENVYYDVLRECMCGIFERSESMWNGIKAGEA